MFTHTLRCEPFGELSGVEKHELTRSLLGGLCVWGGGGGVRRGYLSTPLTGNRLTQTFDFSGPAGAAAAAL